jgi:hypothetical protein
VSSGSALGNINVQVAQIADGKLAIKEDLTNNLATIMEGISQSSKAQPADDQQEENYPDSCNYTDSDDEADLGYPNDENEAIDG